MLMLTLTGICAILMGACLADSHTGTGEPKVLIIGAGMSGVTVAKSLEEAGHHNFLLIEGSTEIGGRVKSVQLSGNTVELGSMWVYGAGNNPIYKLLNEYNISMAEDYPDGWMVRDIFGNDVTANASDIQSRWDDAIEAYDNGTKDALNKDLPDFTLASRLRSHHWNPKTILDDVIESFNCDFEFGVSPAYLSGKHSYWWAPYEAFDNDDVPIVNDPRGFEALVKHLARNFTQNEDRIQYNEVVTQIKQDKDGVHVLTSSGSSYHGDFVVVTVSLGVLQSDTLTFDPELPVCKRQAIDEFGMSSLTQIYLKFPSVFWDDDAYILYASEQRGKYSVWVNMDVIQPGSNILQLTVWNEESRRIERLDDEEVIDDILRHLRLMYPNHVIPSPVNYTISKWTYDPLTLGAYSYWPTGFTTDNMADMMARFGRVFFAGEHTDPLQYSYLHAAYASGRRTASDILQCFQHMGFCESTIDYFQCSQEWSGGECVSKAGTSLHLSHFRFLGWQTIVIALTSFIVKIHLF